MFPSQLEALLQAAKVAPMRAISEARVSQQPEMQPLLASSLDLQAELAIEVLIRLAATARMDLTTAADYNSRNALRCLASVLLRRKLIFDEPRMLRLLEAASRFKLYYVRQLPISWLLRQLESWVDAHGLAPAVRSGMEPFAKAVRDTAEKNQSGRKLVERVESLLRHGPEPGTPPQPPLALIPGEAWMDALLAELEPLSSSQRSAWGELLRHCTTATSAEPKKKWLDIAAERIRAVGEADFLRIAAIALSRIGEPGSRVVVCAKTELADPTLIDDRQADLLRGLVWTASIVADERLLAVLGRSAEACFKKLPWHGPRNAKVGNACLLGLSRSDRAEAIGWLSRLRLKVKHESSRKQLDAALERAAQRAGLSAEELEEMSVPTCGLDEPGLRRECLGEFTAELRVAPSGAVELSWLQQSGKPQKSVPAAVRQEHAEALAELKRDAKELEALLPAQRNRLEGLLLGERSWNLAVWRERYLDHPLVGVLARRLIWRFRQEEECRLGIWREGRIVDVDGEPLRLPDDTRVALWHPMESGASEVQAWRIFLEEREMRQPFKQAHREIYVLTEAERETAVYSNRFAAHVLRQHQLAALCAERGWSYKVQGAWDGANAPRRAVPGQGRIEFWVDGEGGPQSGTGVFLYVSTDQVRFYDDQGAVQPLEQVPRRVFSEILRDVDLFVSVCTVGNDPQWRELIGQPAAFGTYWNHYAFGELNATARTRRDILERLVPKLKIADRCRIADRFLEVRGDLRTYKIHLSSGNILMEPNDQYLCIVPDRSRDDPSRSPALPFDGDAILSVILSKAFLLAADRKINDPLILRQIQS
jgi:hypothetical protein